MALDILFTVGNTQYGRQWHVGEPSPLNYAQVSLVTEIQADGHELDHIKNMWCSRVTLDLIPKGAVVRFFGDQAKTIVGNLTNVA